MLKSFHLAYDSHWPSGINLWQLPWELASLQGNQNEQLFINEDKQKHKKCFKE